MWYPSQYAACRIVIKIVNHFSYFSIALKKWQTPRFLTHRYWWGPQHSRTYDSNCHPLEARSIVVGVRPLALRWDTDKTRIFNIYILYIYMIYHLSSHYILLICFWYLFLLFNIKKWKMKNRFLSRTFSFGNATDHLNAV